ncbi:M24 family metallopeptidase [Thermodesulfobacteriota bacterium]
METMQPVMKWGRYVWDKINMPETEFLQRVKAIKDEMRKERIDVLLVYGRGTNYYGNSCYISNYYNNMPNGALAVIPLKDEVALLYEGFPQGVAAAKAMTWVKEVRVGRDASEECIKYLEEKGLVPAAIGLAGLRELMPYSQWQNIQKSFKQYKVTDSGHIIRNLRMVKSQKECDQIRRGSRIVTNALNLIPNAAHPEMKEGSLQAFIERSAYLDGAEDCRILFARPMEEKWTFRPTEDTPLSGGDSIIVYLAVEFERYWAEGIRTYVAKPHHLVEPDFEDAKTAYQQMLSEVKPGIKSAELYRGITNLLKKNKVTYLPEPVLGQGIGLSLHEFPVINEDDTTKLKEWMCFNLRLATSDREVGAIMIGHTLCLSKDGAEVLTQ